MTKYFKNEFAVNGDKIDIPNEIQASGEVSYQTGFGIDYQRKLGTDILAKPFPRQGFNGLVADLTGALKQYQENGFFDFITPKMNGGQPFAYSMGACIRYDMSGAQDGSDIRNFLSKINDNIGNPKDNSDDWQEIGKIAGSAYQFTSINSDVDLNTNQAGIILIDATAGNITISLPTTSLNLSFTLKRIDNTANIVKIKSDGSGTIKYNLDLNPNGYSSFQLFGAGDYWQVVSDGVGNWHEMDRKEKLSIGSLKYNTSLQTPSGGYLEANGSELLRSDYPSLWDYAQNSGIIADDDSASSNEMDGFFTRGNGTTTFRLPDLRGLFLRSFDSARGVDADRVAGNLQGDAIRNIRGTTSGYAAGHDGKLFTLTGSAAEGFNANATNRRTIIFDASKIVPTAEENRPKNVAYPILIKTI